MIAAMTLRATASLALAAFGVHQVRYLLVPDVHADTGHAYLAGAPIVLALLLALAGGRALSQLGRRARPGRRLSWAAATAAIVAVHVAQEGCERLIAGGGPLDRGALLVVPLAAIAGALVAWALLRADRLLTEAVAPARAPRARPRGGASGASCPRTARATGRVLARHLAGRAPPAFG